MHCSKRKSIGYNGRNLRTRVINNQDNEENHCPICMDNISKKRNYIVLMCGHEFCSTCILQNIVQTFSEQCPICRAKITSNETNSSKLTKLSLITDSISKLSQFSSETAIIIKRTSILTQAVCKFTLRLISKSFERLTTSKLTSLEYVTSLERHNIAYAKINETVLHSKETVLRYNVITRLANDIKHIYN
jgi:hypothetical protein